MRELAQKATPGPWEQDGNSVMSDPRGPSNHVCTTDEPDDYNEPKLAPDAAFIAACSPERILAYEDCVSAMREMLDRFGDARDPCEKIACRKARSALAALDALGEP